MGRSSSKYAAAVNIPPNIRVFQNYRTTEARGNIIPIDIGSSTTGLTTNQLNFYSAVYPLLLKAQSNGVQVICVAGDRTSYTNIAYRTDEGVYLLATGLLSTAPPEEKCVIEFEHDVAAGTLGVNPRGGEVERGVALDEFVRRVVDEVRAQLAVV